ncbi:MAG: peptidoglycan editing factor PgeF [Prevotella sp.]|nr:peptidoglycan editing factor PgeF [Prevotella sp.]
MTTSAEAPQLLCYDMGDMVLAFSTMRQGVGVSQGAYACFNINHYCGDEPQAVQVNRRLLCEAIGVDMGRLVIPHQTHGTAVRLIEEDFFTLSHPERARMLEGVDAVMTDMAGVCIGVSTADCIPVLLCDEAHHAVCAVHAGWRGTVARIVQSAVREMKAAYQTRPGQLRAVIGPGISLKNFEVGDEVYQAFAEAGFDMSAMARRYEKWHIDLPLCNQMQLEEAGVPSAQIHQAKICTYDDYDRFFSARRLGIRSGRIFTGIMRKV